jgi:glutamine amidotransferase PdxT
MKDYDALTLLKSETGKLSDTLRKNFMLIADKHGFEFAGNCVTGACINSIAIILNTQIHDERDEALTAILEEITRRTNTYGKSVDAFVDKAKLS